MSGQGLRTFARLPVCDALRKNAGIAIVNVICRLSAPQAPQPKTPGEDGRSHQPAHQPAQRRVLTQSEAERLRQQEGQRRQSQQLDAQMKIKSIHERMAALVIPSVCFVTALHPWHFAHCAPRNVLFVICVLVYGLRRSNFSAKGRQKMHLPNRKWRREQAGGCPPNNHRYSKEVFNRSWGGKDSRINDTSKSSGRASKWCPLRPKQPNIKMSRGA